jgi:hypothetical protein
MHLGELPRTYVGQSKSSRNFLTASRTVFRDLYPASFIFQGNAIHDFLSVLESGVFCV